MDNVHFQCVYVRRVDNHYQLVAQWITLSGDDFTFDEEVLATADTPRALPLLHVGRDFEMPIPPSMRH